MFENLRSAFHEAMRNFRDELHRDEVPEAVGRLLHGMKQETAEARARLHDLEEGIRRARAEAAREGEEAARTRRRGQMADGIGDKETAAIAADYADRHERRQRILEQKAAALEEELALRRADVEEMIEKIREAERGREGLTAAAGRTQARESVRAGDDLFDELDRMADLASGGAEHQRATEDLLDELAFDDLNDAPPPPRGPDLDERLAELKRRMGQS